MPEEQRMHMASRGRERALRFSEARFKSGWLECMRRLL
jgi:hypothetical protein